MTRFVASITCKRMFDLVSASVALVVLSPLLLMVAILVLLRLGTPIFFRQVRPGLNAEPFMLLKFRTMTEARGTDGELLRRFRAAHFVWPLSPQYEPR